MVLCLGSDFHHPKSRYTTARIMNVIEKQLLQIERNGGVKWLSGFYHLKPPFRVLAAEKTILRVLIFIIEIQTKKMKLWDGQQRMVGAKRKF